MDLHAWEAARTAPGALDDPTKLAGLDWHPARIPGTSATVLAELDAWTPTDDHDFDSEDWWFRTSFAADAPKAGEEVVLCLDGLATVAEVYLNGSLVLESDSMFVSHELEVGAELRGQNELAICFRALSELLRQSRRPRARWRTRVVADGSLRFFRTTMLGRAPGFAPRPAPVGPWRPARVVRRRQVSIDALQLVPTVKGDDGRLEAMISLRSLAAEVSRVALTVGDQAVPLSLEPAGSGRLVALGAAELPSVARWWPHTHGEPKLYDASLTVACGDSELRVDAGRVGFRTLEAGRSPGHEVERDGIDLHLNGVRIFCRGAVWTPADPVGLAPSADELRASLEAVKAAGFNMLRLAGTGVYESELFYDLCDELGILVWQDLMFANLDYPFASDSFRQLVEREAGQLFSRLNARPSVTVLCGNSEIEQQVGMLGLDPELGRDEMFATRLPELAHAAGLDAIYVPSAPCGGELPFRPDAGVSNYFGVGAYLRPLEDVRRADVRFASECLAFSNVPDEDGVEAVMPEEPQSVVVHHPRWKLGVPRDVGAGWDFEDVRDHYLEQLFGVDARKLRSVDQSRYLELSRAVTGEVMAEVFGEWRRAASPCGGGVVLWWRDLMPGAGWGVVDRSGRPKVAYHHLRRVLAPVAVWTTDEGLGGVRVHVANERPVPLRARLRVALYRDRELRTAESDEPLELAPATCVERSVEGMLGHFVDAAWAYRFGPPPHDVIVVSLESDGHPEQLLSQAFRFPAGRPLTLESPVRMGIEGEWRRGQDGGLLVAIRSRRLAYGVRIHARGFISEDQGFSIEPGRERLVALGAEPNAEDAAPAITITALNLEGSIRLSER